MYASQIVLRIAMGKIGTEVNNFHHKNIFFFSNIGHSLNSYHFLGDIGWMGQ